MHLVLKLNDHPPLPGRGEGYMGSYEIILYRHRYCSSRVAQCIVGRTQQAR